MARKGGGGRWITGEERTKKKNQEGKGTREEKRGKNGFSIYFSNIRRSKNGKDIRGGKKKGGCGFPSLKFLINYFLDIGRKREGGEKLKGGKEGFCSSPWQRNPRKREKRGERPTSLAPPGRKEMEKTPRRRKSLLVVPGRRGVKGTAGRGGKRKEEKKRKKI